MEQRGEETDPESMGAELWKPRGRKTASKGKRPTAQIQALNGAKVAPQARAALSLEENEEPERMAQAGKMINIALLSRSMGLWTWGFGAQHRAEQPGS